MGVDFVVAVGRRVECNSGGDRERLKAEEAEPCASKVPFKTVLWSWTPAAHRWPTAPAWRSRRGPAWSRSSARPRACAGGRACVGNRRVPVWGLVEYRRL